MVCRSDPAKLISWVLGILDLCCPVGASQWRLARPLAHVWHFGDSLLSVAGAIGLSRRRPVPGAGLFFVTAFKDHVRSSGVSA